MEEDGYIVVLSWAVLAIETGDRWWRMSTNSLANNHVGIGFFWSAAIVSAAALVAIFSEFFARFLLAAS
jgi:hypothetical protein